METKFTPGPWSVREETCSVCRERGGKEFSLNGPPGGYHDQFSNEADAYLCAAAPELYEAVKAALNMVECDGCPPDWDMLRAALLKARGEAGNG